MENQFASSKTTRNYFISKASGMKKLLIWAEDVQSEPVTQGHVADYVNSGACLNHDPRQGPVGPNEYCHFSQQRRPHRLRQCPARDRFRCMATHCGPVGTQERGASVQDAQGHHQPKDGGQSHFRATSKHIEETRIQEIEGLKCRGWNLAFV